MADLRVTDPATGETVGFDYYTSMAPVLLPHLTGHPLTLHRFPTGSTARTGYETRAPSHPDWVRTVTFHMQRTGKVFDVVVVDDLPSLVWAAQMAEVALHPYLGTASDLDRPECVVFDLDPGPPAGMADRVAACIREVLAGVGLRSWPRTSGGFGIT